MICAAAYLHYRRKAKRARAAQGGDCVANDVERWGRRRSSSAGSSAPYVPAGGGGYDAADGGGVGATGPRGRRHAGAGLRRLQSRGTEAGDGAAAAAAVGRPTPGRCCGRGRRGTLAQPPLRGRRRLFGSVPPYSGGHGGGGGGKEETQRD
ncbi:unnamed protein product [Callosobruchus maculatus]|uniref:Uncharacterized protein n=1 Tax=Callosobruchus maculatus TaxID=64391 RepID=A0A653BUP4_CALMS|nr:unnamed protein product [Callosobruchus maculatus]